MSPMFPELEAALHDAQRRLQDAQKALIDARIVASPFKVGDEVVAKVRNRWTVAIVREVVVAKWPVAVALGA